MAVAQKLVCRVHEIRNHGEHVFTVVLKPEGRVPRFRPGQFLHLALDTYDPSGFWPESRVFSIASPPADRERLRITYSVRGRFTERLERELVQGKQVWVKLPYGDFVVEESGDVALFAGGTGITAFTAFLEGLEPRSDRRVCLAYGARTSDLLIYRDLVHRSVMRTPELNVSYFMEQGSPQEPAGNPGNEVVCVGRVSVAALWPRIESPMTTTYYISGPPAMLLKISQDLLACGVGAGYIKTDAWE